MSEGDLMPIGGHRKKPVDPKRIEAIKAGGKKALTIKENMEAHHRTKEVPEAEEELLKALEKVNHNQ